MYDVVVVGGGPAGCMAGKYAAKAGASTLIIEEDAVIGEPVQCAGLISARAIEESELRNRNSFMNCEIKRAVLHSPSYELTLESPTQRAFAISRDVFDRELAKEAQREGAEIVLNTKLKRVRKSEGGEKLRITTATPNGAEEIEAKVIIGADGVRSTVSQLAGLNLVSGNLSCVQIEGEYETEDTSAEIFLGKSIAPGFFLWIIPLGRENRARIGLCIDRKASTHPSPLLFLKRNLAEHPVIARRYRGTIFSRTAGKIPIPVNGWRRQRSVKIDDETGILLVGDAAAQIKPITGGGVYYGMKCGKIAGELAAKACRRGDMRVLKDYERRWRDEIGKEVAFGLKVHRLRCVMSDRDFDTILHTLSRSEILERIKNAGDMDYPSIVFRELLTNPRIIRVMARNTLRYLYTK
ncbi:MAG: NAD(P)/FAD-dependent oxidoreductase [Candidatus Methanospirareceae archaeon]